MNERYIPYDYSKPMLLIYGLGYPLGILILLFTSLKMVTADVRSLILPILLIPITICIIGIAPAMSGNIHPTDMAAVFAPNKQGNMAVFPMIWGFTVDASPKPLINCRIETADQKPVWKDSWFKRRCVIPASWYYEWGIPPSEIGYRNANEQRNIKKEKYAIQPE